MNRRNFIKNTALIAAAGSFLPKLFAQSSSSIEIASIPQGLPQIRHGLLLPEAGQKLLSSCTWLGKVDYQKFLRNGLENGEEGMEHYSLELNNQSVQIALESNQIWLSTSDKVQKLEWSETVEAEGFHFQAVQTKAKKQILWKAESMLLLLKGQVQHNGQALKKGQLAYWKPTSQLSIAAQTAFILIHPI